MHSSKLFAAAGLLPLFLYANVSFSAPQSPTLPTSPAAQPVQAGQARSGGSADVAMNLQSRRPTIIGRINGGEPMEILFDTGSQSAMIAQSLATNLGLKIIGEVLVGSPAGGTPIPAKIVMLDQLDIGNYQVRNIEAVTMDDSKFVSNASLIIGNNQFKEAQIEINFAEQRLRLTTAVNNDSKGWNSLDGRGLPTGTVTIGNEVMPLYIDSGNPGWLDLPKTAAEKLPLKGPLREAGMIKLVDRNIAKFTAPMDVVANVAGTDVRLVGDITFAEFRFANLGGRALKNARMLIDMPNRRWKLVFNGEGMPQIGEPVVSVTPNKQ
jgi:Aspartyl protease